MQYNAAPDLLEEEDDENHFERKLIRVLLIEFEIEDDEDEKKKVVRLFL